MNASNADATLVCKPDHLPLFTQYNGNYFNSLSEKKLSNGDGLVLEEEKLQNQRFVKANDNVLNNCELSKVIRSSCDSDWINNNLPKIIYKII